jgi:hypothetical protein
MKKRTLTPAWEQERHMRIGVEQVDGERIDLVIVTTSGDERIALQPLEALTLASWLVERALASLEANAEPSALGVSGGAYAGLDVSIGEKCLVCGHYHGGQGSCITAHAMIQSAHCPTCVAEGIGAGGAAASMLKAAGAAIASTRKDEGGPKYAPQCSACGARLARSPTGQAVSFEPCALHPNAPPTYRLQKPRDGYPAGWPMCSAGCGRPTLDGKATCGDVECNYLAGVAGRQ